MAKRRLNTRQTSQSRPAKGRCFVDTSVRIERVIVQVMKGERRVSTVEIAIEVAFLCIVDRHSSVWKEEKTGSTMYARSLCTFRVIVGHDVIPVHRQFQKTCILRGFRTGSRYRWND